MGYSDDTKTGEIYFQRLKWLKCRWRCKSCGTKNECRDLRGASCENCGRVFDQYSQSGDVYSEETEDKEGRW